VNFIYSTNVEFYSCLSGSFLFPALSISLNIMYRAGKPTAAARTPNPYDIIGRDSPMRREIIIRDMATPMATTIQAIAGIAGKGIIPPLD